MCHEKLSNLGDFSDKTTTNSVKGDTMDALVTMHVRHILCGPDWDLSIKSEMERTSAKWKGCMLRTLREFKGNNPNIMPIIPNIVASVAAEVGAGR